VQNQGDITFTNEQFLALVELNKKQQEQIASLELKVLQLTEQNQKFSRALFGSKHERFEGENNVNQLSLSLGLDAIKQNEALTEEIAYTRTKKADAKKPVRSTLPADLPRKVIVIEPQEDTTGMRLIGYEVTEQLEMTPSRIYVNEYRRAKYAKPQGQGVIIGKLPELPFPKAIAGSTVVAHLLVSKYVDHLPLYRQEKIFKRSGIIMPGSTMSDSCVAGIELVTIIYDQQKELLSKSIYHQFDETPIKVLSNEKKGATHRGYFWVDHAPPDKMVIFHYDKSRSASVPEKLLKGYRGHLQTDGYSGYNNFENKDGIILLSCMAHARRYFFEAKNNDKVRSEYFMNELKPLYALEQKFRDTNASAEIIFKERQEIAIPILNELHLWLKKNIIEVTPQSTIGKAIVYSLARWEKLMRYTTDAILQIDNNLIENQIRPVALGRKNYLFCGSHESAQRAAIIYSLFGTCKLNGINPEEWLNDVFVKLPTRKAGNIDDLLPTNWKPSN
jgi:transposase